MNQLRVLVVDDESIIRFDLREMLTGMGFDVVGEAGTGEVAVTKFRELVPDLVFLDIKLPDIDGFEVLRRMNDQVLRPVIILTAYSDPSFVEHAAELGAAAYIVKPVEPSAVLPAVRVAVAHFAQLDNLRAENESLKQAIEVSKRIGRAKTLLIEREGLSERDALRKMQKWSMDRNMKIGEVADAVMLVYGDD